MLIVWEKLPICNDLFLAMKIVGYQREVFCSDREVGRVSEQVPELASAGSSPASASGGNCERGVE